MNKPVSKMTEFELIEEERRLTNGNTTWDGALVTVKLEQLIRLVRELVSKEK